MERKFKLNRACSVIVKGRSQLYPAGVYDEANEKHRLVLPLIAQSGGDLKELVEATPEAEAAAMLDENPNTECTDECVKEATPEATPDATPEATPDATPEAPVKGAAKGARKTSESEPQ